MPVKQLELRHVKHLYSATSGNCSCSGAIVSLTERAYSL